MWAVSLTTWTAITTRSDGTYPLAHNPVTSHYLSGPVRFPVDLRLYRRYEKSHPRAEAFVHKHFPDRVIPTKKKERPRFHKDVAPSCWQTQEFQTLHQQFHCKIDLGIELLEAAIAHKVPFSVLLFDSWYLAEELVSMARYRKRLDQLAEEKPELGDPQLHPQGRGGETRSLGGASDCRGRPRPAHPTHGVPGGDRAGQNLLDIYPGCAAAGWSESRPGGDFKSAELTGTYVVLVTNRVDWDAQRIITLYLQLWWNLLSGR